jgi:hypothetical protein
MMVVDAKDEQICRFYEKSGFSKLDDDTRRMYIMRRELDKFVSQEGVSISTLYRCSRLP